MTDRLAGRYAREVVRDVKRRMGQGERNIDLYDVYDGLLLGLREAVIREVGEEMKKLDRKYFFDSRRVPPLNPVVFRTVAYTHSPVDKNRTEVEAADFHLKLRGIYSARQIDAIKETHPVIIGMGATGEYAAHNFARMGVKGITMVDPDVFEPTNIGRTLFCSTDSIGRKKVDWVKERLEKINPFLDIEVHDEMISEELLRKISKDRKFLHDACDDPQARILIHRYGRRNNKICLTTGCGGAEGRYSTFYPEDPYWEKVFSPSAYKSLTMHPLVPAMLAIQRVNDNIKMVTGEGGIIRYPHLLSINLSRRNPMVIRNLN